MTIGNMEDTKDLTRYVMEMIRSCEVHAAERKREADRVMDYYNGKMNDLPAEEGRSQCVSRDVRAVVKKILPSIVRTLLSHEKIVDFRPVRPEDEQSARQATEYVNNVVIRRSGAKRAIYDAIFDALSVKVGILKWVAYTRKTLRIREYSDQPFSALLGLGDGKNLVITRKRESMPSASDQDSCPKGAVLSELDTDPLIGEAEGIRYDFILKHVEETIDIRLESVPREAFLIDPSAASIEESLIVGERQIVTRSELVSRGFDRDLVDKIPPYIADNETKGSFAVASVPYSSGWDAMRAMEAVLVYEVYVRLDRNLDGIAKLYKICLTRADGSQEDGSLILEMELVEEAPYAEVVAEREAHRFEGRSITEDVLEIQRIKTALLRETLDNIYWQNKKQPVIDPSKLTETGMDAIYNPAFGKPIALRAGASLREAVQWIDVPFMADRSFAMMAYLDEEVRNRTGVTDSAGGVSPELLRDMTKFAVGLVSESGVAQAAMIVDTLSGNGEASGGGIARAFKGLLKLVVAHGGKTRLEQVDGRWVEYDPARWNPEMECMVNVGLGAGSKERDLFILEMVLGLQKELVATMGVDNPFVKPSQIYNVIEKITETSGFQSAKPYFTKPDDEAVAERGRLRDEKMLSEEERRLQLQIRLDQMKADAKIQLEKEQMEADIHVRHVELEKKAQLELLKTQHAGKIAILKNELELLKQREKFRLEREKLGLIPSEQAERKNNSVHGEESGIATEKDILVSASVGAEESHLSQGKDTE